MKSTEYFKFTRLRPDRAQIRDEWIENTIKEPIQKEMQTDGRIRLWGYIPELDKVLRVILLSDGETVHNAFFDRSYKKGE
jgi:hypothetical protein